MTVSAHNAGAGRKAFWTRDKIIERIVRWNDLYGAPPVSADWNPSAAKWSASVWRVARYKAGDPTDGSPWPSLNAAKKLFGGSLSAAVVAAGFEPTRPGPKARRDVEVDIERADPGELRVLVGKAEADARELRKSVEVRERQLARAREATKAATDALEAARRASRRPRTTTITKTKVKVREDSSLKARAARLAEQVKLLKSELKGVKLDERTARMDAAKEAARLERSEATVRDLRADMRELKRDLERTSDTADRLVGAARRNGAAPKVEVREVVRVEKEIVVEAAPERVEMEAAFAEAKRAKERADLAEARYAEIADAAVGERRVLTEGELKKLREGGPSGEAVLGKALVGLAAARRAGGRQPLRVALTEIASAAVRWRDRL